MIDYNNIIIGWVCFCVGLFWLEFPPRGCMSREALFSNDFLGYLPVAVFIILAVVAILINWSNFQLLYAFLFTV